MRELKDIITTWLPPLAGVALIALFVSLALWQLDRAAQKEALFELFTDAAPAMPLAAGDRPALYQQVEISGRYLPDRQFLLDNIIRNSQVGYYVITPFAAADDGRVLLVNRGWLPKERHGASLPAIGVGGERRTIVARAGRLPRVGIRPGHAVSAGQAWPKVAVYPQVADLASELGRPLAEPVLLLAPSQAHGYQRDWQPEQKGSMMHYGYAFQWSALALTVLLILAWQLRKRLRHE